MWWSKHFATMARFTRLGVALVVAGLVAGCFEPLYGERSFTGAGTGVRDKLSGVDVLPIEAPNGRPEARLGVEVRNALLFDTTGGGAQSPPTHKLKIRL